MPHHRMCHDERCRVAGPPAMIEDLQERGLAVERLRVEPTPSGSVHGQEEKPAPSRTMAMAMAL
ncbi:hypothetical protein THIOKS13100001 [Thiocapsa sp. KS1]|nr:hypothetical protein THIOKS13100001 [Thiocapsa sp. KS1]